MNTEPEYIILRLLKNDIEAGLGTYYFISRHAGFICCSHSLPHKKLTRLYINSLQTDQSCNTLIFRISEYVRSYVFKYEKGMNARIKSLHKFLEDTMFGVYTLTGYYEY